LYAFLSTFALPFIEKKKAIAPFLSVDRGFNDPFIYLTAATTTTLFQWWRRTLICLVASVNEQR
jgi:hypothetical protein